GREFRGNFREFIPRVTDRAGGETPPGGTIVMGEVAGKGIRTALIMADAQLEIRRLLGSSPFPVYRTFTASLAPGDWVFLASNASTTDLIYSWRYFGFEGYRGTETPGAALIASFRQRAFRDPPATDVAIFCFGRKCE